MGFPRQVSAGGAHWRNMPESSITNVWAYVLPICLEKSSRTGERTRLNEWEFPIADDQRATPDRPCIASGLRPGHA